MPFIYRKLLYGPSADRSRLPLFSSRIFKLKTKKRRNPLPEPRLIYIRLSGPGTYARTRFLPLAKKKKSSASTSLITLAANFPN